MNARNLVSGLKRLEAIELLEALGEGFVDNDGLDHGISKIATTLRNHYISVMPSLSPIEEGFVMGGSKIDAIKSYKKRNPEYGLVESKLKVDQFGQ